MSSEDGYESRPLTQLFLTGRPASDIGSFKEGVKFNIEECQINLEGASPGRLIHLDHETVNYSAFASVMYCVTNNTILMKKLLCYEISQSSTKAVVTLFNNINNQFTEQRFDQRYLLRNNKHRTPVSFSLISNTEGMHSLMDLSNAYINTFARFDDYVAAMNNSDPLDYFIMFTGASRWKIDIAEIGESSIFTSIRSMLQRGMMVIGGRGGR